MENLNASVIFGIAGILLLILSLIMNQLPSSGWFRLFGFLDVMMASACYFQRFSEFNLSLISAAVLFVEILLMGYFIISGFTDEKVSGE